MKKKNDDWTIELLLLLLAFAICFAGCSSEPPHYKHGIVVSKDHVNNASGYGTIVLKTNDTLESLEIPAPTYNTLELDDTVTVRYY